MSLISSLSDGVCRLARLGAGAALGVGLIVGLAPDRALAQTAEAVVPATAQSRPALWVVRDADSTIYLFGTVHLMRPGSDWMTPEVTQAFEGADELWLEIEDPGDAAAAQPLILQYGLSPQTPLQSVLTSEEFARLDQAAQSIGLSAAALNPMRPWLAGLTLSVAPLTRAGYDPQAGVDMMLRARAVEVGKPIRGLETMEQQIRFFAELPEADQVAFLRETLASFDQAETMLDAMAGAWAMGEPDALYALGGDEMKAQYPHFHDVILTNRNADWAGQIQEELAGSGTVFMAVGALHLAGPDSVQAQLATRGVQAERVQ